MRPVFGPLEGRLSCLCEDWGLALLAHHWLLRDVGGTRRDLRHGVIARLVGEGAEDVLVSQRVLDHTVVVDEKERRV